ncbi:MAG TPA: tetratricopeptide repeat protein, partial [Planctomycetaceae bacterium]
DFSRESTVRCLECHNTWFHHVPGTPNQYRPDSFLMGVTCENCHGPGREHVAYHAAHAGEKSGRAIVRPASLSRERQIEVCTQCHSNAIKHKGPALNYRPGEPLADYYKTLAAPRNTEDDHVANQVKYLRQSRCFQNSDEMTCTTCHDPHRPLNSTASGIESCRKCHNDADCREQVRLPAAVKSECVACHMPQYIKINVNFETEDDNYVPPIRRCEHRIAIHPRARDEVVLAWRRTQDDPLSRREVGRLTKSLVDDWLAEADTCRGEFRYMGAMAAIREALRLDPAPQTREKLRAAVATHNEIEAGFDEAVHCLEERRYGEAIEALNRILKIKPDLAKAHGRLGTAYAATGNNELAVKHLRLVARFDADNPYGCAMLGWLAYLRGDAQEAVGELRQADEIEPYNAQLNYHWGLALMKLERWDEAAQHFRLVLTIDPAHAGGCQALAHALRKTGELEESLRLAQRAVRLTRFENADTLLTLSDLYADLGRFAEAVETAIKALDAAQIRAPQSMPQIRQKLEELRARVPSTRNGQTGESDVP